jgi:hypothetical protein
VCVFFVVELMTNLKSKSKLFIGQRGHSIMKNVRVTHFLKGNKKHNLQFIIRFKTNNNKRCLKLCCCCFCIKLKKRNKVCVCLFYSPKEEKKSYDYSRKIKKNFKDKRKLQINNLCLLFKN